MTIPALSTAPDVPKLKNNLSEAKAVGYEDGYAACMAQEHTVGLDGGEVIKIKGAYESGDKSVGIQGGWRFECVDEKEIAALHQQLDEAKKREAELRAEIEDHNRWMLEMLTDYRIAFDNHTVGRRLALNQFIHTLRDAAQKRVGEWEKAIPIIEKALNLMDYHGPESRADNDDRREFRDALTAADSALKALTPAPEAGTKPRPAF